MRDHKRDFDKRKAQENQGPVRTNGPALPFKQAVGSAHRAVVDKTEPLAMSVSHREWPAKRFRGDPECVAETPLERSHIDAEAVFHIALQHPLIRLIDFLHRNHFHVGNDIMRRAEIEHLLRFGNSAYR
jgi:hypothetical protein